MVFIDFLEEFFLGKGRKTRYRFKLVPLFWLYMLDFHFWLSYVLFCCSLFKILFLVLSFLTWLFTFLPDHVFICVLHDFALLFLAVFSLFGLISNVILTSVIVYFLFMNPAIYHCFLMPCLILNSCIFTFPLCFLETF